MLDHGPTALNLLGCTHLGSGAQDLLVNEVPGKRLAQPGLMPV